MAHAKRAVIYSWPACWVAGGDTHPYTWRQEWRAVTLLWSKTLGIPQARVVTLYTSCPPSALGNCLMWWEAPAGQGQPRDSGAEWGSRTEWVATQMVYNTHCIPPTPLPPRTPVICHAGCRNKLLHAPLPPTGAPWLLLSPGAMCSPCLDASACSWSCLW